MTKVNDRSPSPAKKTARRESRNRFRIFAEMTTTSFMIIQGTRITYANPAMEKLCGYTRRELARINYFNLFPPELNKTLYEWAKQVARGEITSPMGEFNITTKSGERRWIDVTIAMIEQEGEAAAFVTAYDITERKRAELLQDAVYRIAQAADRSKRLDNLFPALHKIIGEVMPANNFYITLMDAESGLMTFPYIIDDYDSKVEPQKPGKGLTEYMMGTGKSLLCTQEVFKRLLDSGEVELVGAPSPIWLGVPLVLDGNVIGAMVVQDYEDAGAFGEQEQRILEFVSSQVAMAIDRKRAEDSLRENEERLRRRADELTVLYETTRDISSERDTKTLLQSIVDRAAMLMSADGGYIYLHDVEKGDLELRVAHGNQAMVGMRFKGEDGLLGKVAKSLKPMAVEDYRTWEERSPMQKVTQITALVAVPMIYAGKLQGVLSVFQLDNGKDIPLRKYSTSEVEQLSFFAGSAAIAVHNAQLFDETRQRLLELELLYQASLSSVQIHSLRAVAQRIVDALEKLLEWRASIWLIEGKRPVLLANSPQGLEPDASKEIAELSTRTITSFENGIVGWVCKYGRSIRTGNVLNNPLYVPVREDVRSELCVPLKVGGKTVGCINAESALADNFSEQDERLLNTLANQAAAGMENARLFEETRRRAARQAALNEIISASARMGTSLDEILSTAIDQTLRTLNLDMGAVWISWSPRSLYRIAARGLPPTLNAMMANASLAGFASTPRTLVVNNWHEAKHQFAETFLAIGIQATILLPLVSNDLRIGGMTVASQNERKWTQEEVTLVEAIGREVTLAAERTRLFEETNNRINELEVVNRVSKSLRLAQGLDAMLPQLLDETLKAFTSDAGAIWLHDGQMDILVQRAARGWCAKAEGLGLAWDENLLGSVMESGDVYYSNDIANDPKVGERLRRMAPEGASGISVPIRTENETIGVFLVCGESPREFSGGDGRLLVTLSEIAGNAIRRMRLNEQTVQHAAELETRVADRTAELQEALQKAQTADRLKSEFIANVNHELRTPLTNLILYYQMLRSQPSVKTEERLDVIGRELQRLRGLIEELLTLSRLDLGKVTFHSERHDLNRLIHTLVDDRQTLAETHGLKLKTELDAGLEPVIVDEPTIVQAVSNLLTNALNYTPAGGQVTVRTMRRQVGDTHESGFSVEDTGPGISEEDAGHIFERFYRGTTGRQSGAPGTGLGLAIVKQVVEFHHGRIEVGKGCEGKGTMFTIWLPERE